MHRRKWLVDGPPIREEMSVDVQLGRPDWEAIHRDFLSGDAKQQDHAAEMMGTYLLSILARLGAYRYANDWSDTCHDVLLKLWQTADGLHSPQALGGWLRKAATNAFYDWCRRPANRRKLQEDAQVDPDILHAIESESASALEALSRQRDLDALEQALAELEPQHREVIDLLFFEGLAREEAASRLGLKLAGLKWRRDAAMRALKKKLLPPNIRPATSRAGSSSS